MVYRGIIIKGKIALDSPLDLPDGTQVVVRASAPSAAERVRIAGPKGWKPSSPLGRLLERSAGAIEGSPPDLARNHDRYCRDGTMQATSRAARRGSRGDQRGRG